MQPIGQQPSPLLHVVIAGYVHTALHIAALPPSMFIVQASLSLQTVGQFPGGSHVSLASTIPLPHTGGILPLDEDELPPDDELPVDDDDETLPDEDVLPDEETLPDEDVFPADDDVLPDEEEVSPEPPIPPTSPLSGSLMTPVQALDIAAMTPKMSVPAAMQRT